MAESVIRLIVGLGNPGTEYRDTRHNAGFWFVDAIVHRHGGSMRLENRFHGEACRVRIDGQETWLLKPTTYMNRSGQSVAALARFYKIAPESILVAHDELDLPPGAVRLKQGGGHAGHNGLRDTQACLGSPAWWRLRFGIGHPGAREDVSNWVLHAPSRDDRERIDVAVQAAVESLPVILAGEALKAMNRLHSLG